MNMRSLRRIAAMGVTTIATVAALALAASGTAQAHTSMDTTPSGASAVAADQLLFYRAGDGLAMSGAVDSNGGFTNLQNVGGFTTGWTHITDVGGA